MIQIVHISDLHFIDRQNAAAVARTINFFASHIPAVANKFARADLTILPLLISSIRVESGLQAHLALTGDICAWPGDTVNYINSLYQHFNQMIGASPGLMFLPILGNHDWGNQMCNIRTTEFINSVFETNHAIAQVSADIVTDGKLNVVVFRIDSNGMCIPASGDIPIQTLSDLSTMFKDGKDGAFKDRNQKTLSKLEYEEALKILMVHHSPLLLGDYGGKLNMHEYHSLRLTNLNDLLDTCEDNIDVFLFGHTHVPLASASDGFVMINAGAALSNAALLGNANYHLINIKDRDNIEVATYYWDGRVSFTKPGSPTCFKRGARTFAGRGYGMWA